MLVDRMIESEDGITSYRIVVVEMNRFVNQDHVIVMTSDVETRVIIKIRTDSSNRIVLHMVARHL
jgi:hypothetical protein